MEENKIVGKRIQHLRKEQGLTQAELSELIDISAPYMHQIETGKKKPSVNVLLSISEVLDVSLDYILLGFRLENENQFKTEIAMLLGDCSPYEQFVIIHTIVSIKEALRENRPVITKEITKEFYNKFHSF